MPQFSGSKNSNWKGDKIGIDAIHWRMHKVFPKTKLCQDCKKVPPIDLANISQKYLLVKSDWEWLCRKCHMTKDGRLKKFFNLPHTGRRKKRNFVVCLICNKKKKEKDSSKLCNVCHSRVRYYNKERSQQTLSKQNLSLYDSINFVKKRFS